MIDLDDSGARLLAREEKPQRPACVINSEKFSAELHERAIAPLDIPDSDCRDFGINE